VEKSESAGLRLRVMATGDADTWKKHVGQGFWDAVVVKDVAGLDAVQVSVYVRGARESLKSYEHYLLDRRVLEVPNLAEVICQLVQNARGLAVPAIGGGVN
jgi:hypothetical protein